MPDLEDGEVAHVQGSAEKPYELKNVGGVYSCSCPAWRNQRGGIERRTCKHLKAYRGEAAELARVGADNIAGKPGTKAAGAAPAASAGTVTTPAASGSKAAVKKETAPPVLLAHTWENDIDLTGWWLSEKLDGVRAYWDGSAFVSRLGNPFLAPDWFVEGLPGHPLDGELWIGRGRFQDTIGTVRRMDKSDAWKQVRYVLFDAPAIDGPFEERLEFLRATFPQGKLEFTHYLEHVPCTGLEHLKTELARVEGLGGEGLMLRKPGSKYVAGRSSTLLKVKSFYDTEARVVAHLPGKGKHKGRLGALDVELPDGTRFSVGTGFTEKEREDPPAVGEIITFRYQELTDGGVPRFPSYVGPAIDKTWPPEGGQGAKPKKVNKTGAAPAPAKPAVAAPTKPAAPAKPAAGGKRRFELVEGGSSKFWEVEVKGPDMTTTWGKIGGSSSSSKTKACADAAAAQAEAAKLIKEKTSKGYAEVGGAPAPAPAPAEEPDEAEDEAVDETSDEVQALAKAQAAPAPPPKPPAAPSKAKKPEPAPAPAPEPEPETEAEEPEAAPAAPAGPPRTTPEGILPPASCLLPPVRAARARLLKKGKQACEVAVVGDTVVERAGDRTVARQFPGHGSAVANAEAVVAARAAEGFTLVEDGPERSPAPRYLVQKKAAAWCEVVVVGDTLVERWGPAGSPGRTRVWQSATAAAAVTLAESRVKDKLKDGFSEA